MIEHIQGAGLSGIAGKGGKQVKNTLFAKLMAMFEQRSQLGSKAHAAGAGKADMAAKQGGLAAGAEKQLIAQGGKAQQGEHTADAQDGRDVTALLATHVPAGSVTEIRKAGLNSDPAAQLAGRSAVAGQQSSGDGSQTLLAGSAGKSILDSAFVQVDRKSATANTASLPGHDAKGERSGAGSAAAGKQQTADVTALSRARSAVDIQASSRQPVQGVASVNSAAVVNEARSGGADVAALQAGGAQEQAYRGLNGNGSQGLGQNSGQNGGQNIGLNDDALSDVDPLKAALAQGAQPKQNQSAQPQGAAATVAAAVPASSSEGSLADSGSQSQERGGQDGRFVSALSNDAKQAANSASASTNFQQYLSGKAAPSMTLFDSMNHIAQAASKGKTQLEIQLEPANLGKIHITLQSDASKQLQIHMIVDQGATRAALEQQLPQLRSALAQQGFDLSGFSMGSQEQQSSFDGHDGHDGGRSGTGSGPFAATDSDVVETVTTTKASAVSSSDAGLSIHI